ncbi:amidase signature domain-containing protein [Podospora aff. communis PSN243]|uniref:Amidase signature domain-containing protein n=1 Tax=Podospora aff. communis PSN243 TaxID=3040156 RepID=A0AAV9GMR7_9PEZI|nr:amidase signature domain-containing protein [Podospora aff. communis PSN243]
MEQRRHSRIYSLLDVTLDYLIQGFTRGDYTSVDLVRAYTARVAEVNDLVHAVIELNPEAESIARALDKERTAKGPRSALHGVPILLKDNVVTLDKTASTSGSAVLIGTLPTAEASIVVLLRRAGLILFGKANVSEFAGFRHTNATTGWSPRGGQATGIFWPNMKASGSSTGSAIAVGLGLAFASFGTETVSSLVSPAEKSCVVGFKPTFGLIPNDGLIPVSRRQDTIGHITRTVRDAAQILDVAVCFDERPEQSRYMGEKPSRLYVESCRDIDLSGVRIGVVRYSPKQIDEPKITAFHEALGFLKEAGAVIYDSLPEQTRSIVLETEFKTDMEAYLSSLAENPRRILTFEDLVNTIKSEPSEDYPERNINIMLRGLKTSKDSPQYLSMLQQQDYYACSGGFKGAMEPMGGIPVMTIPMGFYPKGTKVKVDESRGGLVSVAPGIPFSLHLYGRRNGESQLLQVAYAFEQLSGVQQLAKPYILPQTDLEDLVGSRNHGSRNCG